MTPLGPPMVFFLGPNGTKIGFNAYSRIKYGCPQWQLPRKNHTFSPLPGSRGKTGKSAGKIWIFLFHYFQFFLGTKHFRAGTRLPALRPDLRPIILLVRSLDQTEVCKRLMKISGKILKVSGKFPVRFWKFPVSFTSQTWGSNSTFTAIVLVYFDFEWIYFDFEWKDVFGRNSKVL